MTAAGPADRRHGVAVAVLLAVMIALAGLPFLVGLPSPKAALVLDQARLSLNGGPDHPVRLPHSWQRNLPERTQAVYLIDVVIDAVPDRPQSLFIPSIRQKLVVQLNGRVLYRQRTASWADLSRGYFELRQIPPDLLVTGTNHLVLTLTRTDGLIPAHLSRIYIGDAERMIDPPWLRPLINTELRSISLALHLFIAAGLFAIWAGRPSDPVFRWLMVLSVSSLAMAGIELWPFPRLIPFATSHIVLMLPAFGLMMIGLALAITGRPRPRWLVPAIIIVPALLLTSRILADAPIAPTQFLGAGIGIAGHAVAGVVLLHAFITRRLWTGGLLGVPALLTAWFGLHDVAVAFGLIPGAFLLSTFVRLLTYLAFLILLMSRLATSLNRLDRANDDLRARLAEREAELSILHETEKHLVGQAVREQERRRLMQDLHDGLSGHLVSIIALSETGQRRDDIERTAREALDDLRLVIHSLDLGDTDLPLALAGFRERLTPRLRRLGVRLVWSMEALPDIRGVTPGNALSILRILQEAVTNALKHGPARQIEIRGGPDPTGTAGGIVIVANDGRAGDTPGQGFGLHNMQRRAQQLGGRTVLNTRQNHTELSLYLPCRLNDC
ncbi:histidine kinase [Tistrella mobilis]|uniref:Histidine kinase/HSP90-like ATPase domain-containing protein n=1 Tax=Tistrella mobilis TaxID=171437 RepID=A0A162L0R0_9PROT|nr:ATP-binding protein [Tistrella mobilis]KYO52630.1 hypothetical protein AUP44_04710 [Tistrella mobilis]